MKTLEFLQFLFDPYGESSGLTVEIRPFHPLWTPKPGRPAKQEWFDVAQLDGISSYAANNGKRLDVYFGVLPRVRGGGGSEHLRGAACIWIDFDAGNGTKEETLAFAKVRIQALSIPYPNALVSSGRGWHGYWMLSEVVSVTTDAERETFRRLLKRFAWAVGGDLDLAHACPVSTDCARILRLPGTFNLKDKDNPRPVEAVRLKRGDEKTLLWWRANLPIEPLPPPVRIQSLGFSRGNRSSGFEMPYLSEQMEAWLTEPVAKGERHLKLVDCATRMRKNDVSEDDALRIVTKKAENSGVDVNDRHQQEHLQKIVSWVYSRVLVDENRPRHYRGVEIGNAKR